MKRSCLFGLTAVLLTVVMVSGASAAGSVGARVWFADYDQTFVRGGEEEDFSGGTSPMFMVQFNSTVSERVSGAFMIGYGEGWDEEESGDTDITIRRLDVLGGLSYMFQYFYMGVGAHGVIVWHEFEDPDWKEDDAYLFLAPEILAGGTFVLVPDMLYAQASAAVMPVVWWMLDVDYEDAASSLEGDDSGTTWGYTLDAALILAFDQFRIGGGYRHAVFEEYDYELDFGTSTARGSHDDEFSGPYVMAGFSW